MGIQHVALPPPLPPAVSLPSPDEGDRGLRKAWGAVAALLLRH